MAVADITLVRTQVIEKLQAGPRAARYTDAIGENSDFTVKQEITDNILIVDAAVCGDIISTPGHPYRNFFMVLSTTPLNHGDLLPVHTGAHGDVEVAISSIYKFSTEARSRAEILAMVANPTLYGLPKRYHYIEDSIIFHAGDTAKIWVPTFTKTTACQSPEIYTDVLIYGAVAMSEKDDMESSFFQKYEKLYMACRGMVTDKKEIIPKQEELERILDR